MTHPETAALRGIIFDLDGTLYRMEPFFQPLMFLSLLPRSMRLLMFLSERSKFAGIDFGSREKLYEVFCARLSGRTHTRPDTIKAWIDGRFYPAFISAMRFQRQGRPGLAELLAHLRKQGMKLAVLSDYNAVEGRLRMLRIPVEGFDYISSCEAAGALKPAVRPYTEIARRWNIPARELLVVGDRDDTDGQAAREAGMRFLQITDRKTAATPHENILTWPALRDLLLAW